MGQVSTATLIVAHLFLIHKYFYKTLFTAKIAGGWSGLIGIRVVSAVSNPRHLLVIKTEDNDW